MTPVENSPIPNPFSLAATTQAQLAQGLFQRSIQPGDELIASVTTKVLNWIVTQLESGLSTINSLGAKVSAPIVSGLNQGASTVDSLQGAVVGSIQGQAAAAAAPPSAGGSQQMGVVPDQYAYNVWSDRTQTGWTPPYVSARGVQKQTEVTCFQGSFESLYDAVNFVGDKSNQLPAGSCPLPGVSVVPPVGGPSQVACEQYQVWRQYVGSKCINAGYGCYGDPLPSGGSLYSGPVTLALAQGQVQTLLKDCSGSGIGPPTTGNDWYSGCYNGGPITWEGQSNYPVPVLSIASISGPFPDQPTALAAAQESCTIGPPINPPTTGGQCVCVTFGTGCTLTVDLCDWMKFEDHMAEAIYRGMCKFIKDPECYCKVQDSDKYVVEQCDGVIDQLIKPFMGSLGQPFAASGTVDDIAMAGTSSFNPGDAGPPPVVSPFGGTGP